MKRPLPYLIFIFVLVILLFLLPPSKATAAPLAQQGNYWCGNGSAPDYGFNLDLLQQHWTVGNGLVSEEAMTQVDVVLDELNADQHAQTMILVLPEDQVGIATNCAVHFLRYMQLGETEGPHKDNGFAFVFVVGADKIDVHYAVGLGLPALTAQNLSPLNRLAEETYLQTGSIDTALIETITAYDLYVRSVYEVTPLTNQQTENPTLSPSIQEDTDSAIPAMILFLICLFGFLVIVGIVFISGALLGSNKKNSGKDNDNVYRVPRTPTYYPQNYEPTPTVQQTETPSRRVESTPVRQTPYQAPKIHINHPSAPTIRSLPKPSSTPTFRPSAAPKANPPSRGGSGSGRSGRTN